MRRSLAAITILLAAALALSMFAGCSKKQQTTGSSVTSQPAPSAAEKPSSVGETAKNPTASALKASGSSALSELLSKQKAVTSYVQTIQIEGKSIKTQVKLKDGKPVRAKMDMGKDGMMLIQYDKKAQYAIDTKNNAAMMMPVTSQTAGASNQSGIPGMDDPARLKNLRVTSTRLNGKDCWKVTKAKSDMVFWAGKDNGLPVQVTLGGRTMKFSYAKINQVPDSEFELPAGCRIQMMSNRGAMPSPPPGH